MSTNHDLPPLSPLLRSLVDAERAKVTADPARAASVLAATEAVIAASVATGVAGAAAAGTGVKAAAAAKGIVTLSTGKLVALTVIAFAVGTGVGAAVTRAVAPRPETPALSPAVSARPVVDLPPPPRVEEPVVTAPSATVAARASQTASAAPVPSAAPRGAHDLAQEQAIIDAARAGLASGRNEDVILATERHAQAFPRGQFSEERDAMRIIALVRLGRTAEARKRGDQFRAAYPTSALLPKVDAALQ